MVNPLDGDAQARNTFLYLQPTWDFQRALANAGAHTDPGGTGGGGGTVKRNSEGKVVEVKLSLKWPGSLTPP